MDSQPSSPAFQGSNHALIEASQENYRASPELEFTGHRRTSAERGRDYFISAYPRCKERDLASTGRQQNRLRGLLRLRNHRPDHVDEAARQSGATSTMLSSTAPDAEIRRVAALQLQRTLVVTPFPNASGKCECVYFPRA
jgi:hypothetical protein